MRILMVSDVYYPRVNGVSTSIQTFRSELLKLGVESTLIAPAYDGQDKLVYEMEDDIVRVPSRRILFDPEDRLLKKGYLAEILKLLNSKEFDLVHIQTPFVAHSLGMHLARRLKTPVIETYHTFFEEYFYHYIPFLPKAWLRFAARLLSRTQCNRLDALVVPSSAMREKLLEYGITTRLSVIPTGITLPEEQRSERQDFLTRHGIPTGRPVLLHVGRVAFEKNITFLIDVYAEVKKLLPKAILLIAGEGPARKSLQDKVRKLDLQDGVYFIGYLDRHTELQECYRAGDVFVFASRTETQGLVLLEAMATGLPVVSTAEMGTRDILLSQQGAVVAIEDKRDFSGKVVTLLSDHARLTKMAVEARSYAATWSAGAMAQRMLDFYEDRINIRATAEFPVQQADSGLLTERA